MILRAWFGRGAIGAPCRVAGPQALAAGFAPFPIVLSGSASCRPEP
ncbi:MAG: hypothetical protein ACRYG6_06370 [Janthinobacterium lividum]